MNASLLRGAIYEEYRNMTEFCTASGVPRATMENLIAGRNEPVIGTLAKVMGAIHTRTSGQKYEILFGAQNGGDPK